MGSTHHGTGWDRRQGRRRLTLTLVLAAGYMVLELAGGIISGSLSLLADAAHMLLDVAALALSLFALWLAERPADSRRTFGYYRTEILAALVNAATLIGIAASVMVEAIRRVRAPPEVEGGTMLWVASGGLLVNAAGLFILGPARGQSVNLRGAWLHVLTDGLGSLNAVVAAVLIQTLGWRLADPVASMVISVLVVLSSWSLLRETFSVLMESAPRGIDVDEVRAAIVRVEGVCGVHDLHVWTITHGFDALSAHVVAAAEVDRRELLSRIRKDLHDGFGIDHLTIQVEPEDFDEAGHGVCEPLPERRGRRPGEAGP